MAKKVKLGSTNRYGARYGARNKEKVAALEKQHRRRRKCPFCNYVKVRRVSAGIWQCEKCNAKFAGKAYTFVTPKASKEIVKEEPEEAEEIESIEEQEETPEEEQPEEDQEEKTEAAEEESADEPDEELQDEEIQEEEIPIEETDEDQKPADQPEVA
jgi:large subunit ribosomal protein L37Ae